MREERAQVFFLDAVSDVKPDVRKSLTTPGCSLADLPVISRLFISTNPASG